MAHHRSAIKRIRTSRKANLRNRYYRSSLRTAIRHLRESGTAEEREIVYRRVVSLLDRLAHKGIIHPNQASRKKSRLYRWLTKKVEGSVVTPH
ncbi:MAG: 30S ribosomal protein S20 [bacterium]